MKLVKKIIIFLVLVSLVNCSEEGTIGLVEYGNITGRVVEKEGFEPIENAKVTLSSTNNSTFTDANGNFKFDNVEVESYSVKAEKEGFLNKFEGITVTKDQTVNVVLEMEISTANNRPPTKPELTAPADLATDLEGGIELTWQSTDPDQDALTYKIIIKNNFNTDVITIEDYTESTYTFTEAKYDSKYFWQVAVTDGINDEVLSEVYSFTTKEYPDNRYFYVKNEGGNNVIYSSNLNNDGEAEGVLQLTDANINSWRPRKNNAANLIAFLRTDNNQTHIFTMKPNGKEITKVTSSVPVIGFNLNEVDFSWSSNGEKIIYPNFDKLYSINKDGSGLQMIYQTTDGSLITECDWSDDNSKIALKTNNSEGYNVKIFVIDMSGNVLSTPLSGVNGAAGGLNFSTSGNKLLYTIDVSGFESSNYRQLNSHVMLYDFTTSTETDLSSDKPSGTNDFDARFSPNEAEVIFVNTSNDGVSIKNIMKASVEVDSGTDRQRTTLFTSSTMPDWE